MNTLPVICPACRHPMGTLSDLVPGRRDYYARFVSDAVPSREYLTWDGLTALAENFKMTLTIHRPWYGVKWALRPVKAALLRRREPSSFAVIVAGRKECPGS